MPPVTSLSPELLAEIFAKLPVPVYLLRWEQPPDPASFRLMGGNPDGLRRLLPEQGVGVTLADGYPDAMRSELPAVYAEAIRTGTRRQYELHFRHRDQPEKVMNLTVVPLGDDTVMVLTEDVTARRVAAAQLALDQALMERSQELAHIGTFTWVAAENRLSWSQEMYHIHGRTPSEFGGTMEALLAIIHPDDRANVQAAVLHTMKSREPLRLKVRVVRRDGEIRWLEAAAVVDLDDTGEVSGLHGVTVDITDTVHSAEMSQDRDDTYRLLVSRVKDYAIIVLDAGGRIMSWNEGAERIKGYRANEIIGQHFSIFYTPEDRKRNWPEHLLRTAEAEGRVEEENWRVRKDGSRFWADVVITALRDDSGRLRGFGKVVRDLTERKEAETALAELAGRLLRLQDDERRTISRDLHDTTSPLLTGLISKLYSVRQKIAGSDAVAERLVDESLSNAEAVATAVRTVSALLHPPLLDESGLLPSLRWYLEAYAKRVGTKIDVQFPEKLARLPHDTEIALFRVVQECVTSLARRAGASSARVALKASREMLELQVVLLGTLPPVAVDSMRNGHGEAGIGIAGMRERMRQLGGKLDVAAQDGEVAVTARLPLPD